MEMRKCVNGHYYDASVNSACPYCNSGANTGKTVSLGAASIPSTSMISEGGDSKTLPLGYSAPPAFVQAAAAAAAPAPAESEVGKTIAMAQAVNEDEGRTIAIVHQDTGIDPVVGWLVCISGKEKGRDYRIHSDNNYIGRNEKMDICVRGDETISRDNHATVSYDTVDKIFYFSPGDGRNIVRHNGKAIFQTVELAPYDQVIVGKTELLFVPLCGKNFEWSNEDAVL